MFRIFRKKVRVYAVLSKFGKEIYYPACARAESFARVARTKTIPARVLYELLALGYNVLVKEI